MATGKINQITGLKGVSRRERRLGRPHRTLRVRRQIHSPGRGPADNRRPSHPFLHSFSSRESLSHGQRSLARGKNSPTANGPSKRRQAGRSAVSLSRSQALAGERERVRRRQVERERALALLPFRSPLKLQFFGTSKHVFFPFYSPDERCRLGRGGTADVR